MLDVSLSNVNRFLCQVVPGVFNDFVVVVVKSLPKPKKVLQLSGYGFLSFFLSLLRTLREQSNEVYINGTK